MKKRLQSAILFCILLILFSGCGKTKTEDQDLEHIRISNLKSGSSALSKEEQAYMEEICAVLESAEYLDDDSYFGSIHGCNTSPYDLDLSFYVCGYNKDGCLKYSRIISLKEWKKGQELSYALPSSFPSDVERFSLIGQFEFNGTVYMTDPIPLPINSDQEENSITINYAGYLPTVVSLEQSWADPVSYTLLELSLENKSSTDYHDLILLMRKESGKNNSDDKVSIRIVDEDGNIHYTGEKTIYLNNGETARMVFSIPIYEPGEYYLELK